MKTLKSIGITLTAALAAGLAAGCNVEPSRVTRITGEITRPETFEPQDYRLRNNKFFMWGEKTDEQSSMRVQVLADEIVDADEERYDFDRTRLNPAESRKLAAYSAWREQRRRISSLRRELRDLNGRLDDARRADPADPGRVTELERLVAAKETEMADAETKKDRLEAIKETAEQAYDRLTEEAAAFEQKINAKIAEIMDLVEWFPDQPEAVAFKIEEDGAVTVSIRNWNLGDGNGKRSFTTSNGTIGNTRYDSHGGTFEFEVYTNPGETYEFKVSRANYNDEHGRIYLVGDITRRRLNEEEPGYGVAKMVAGQFD